MKRGFLNLFLFPVKITSGVLSFNRDTIFTQLFNEECAVVFAVDFYFICKLCVLRATEYWKAIHPGLLADTEYVWLQIVWITVDYWTAIQMCVALTVGISTKGDYLVAGSEPPESRNVSVEATQIEQSLQMAPQKQN